MTATTAAPTFNNTAAPTKPAILANRYHIIDVDTHIIEPPDLWTSRVSKKWGDLVPHVKVSAKSGVERWFVGQDRLPAVASVAHAGWKDFPPGFPPTLAQADPATWRAEDRLKRMDQYGIHAQVLYPNLLGFQCESFMRMPDRQLGLDCVRAYNDFLAEFCSLDPERLVPVMWLPFWDVEASVAEIERSARNGHRGVIFGGDFTVVGLPSVHDKHWDPIYAAAEHHQLSINFHIGFAAKTTEEARIFQSTVRDDKAAYVKGSTMLFMGNALAISDLILYGVCERFPKLNFVSVESGASWLPFLVEALDWQWLNAGGAKLYAGRMLPSDYFRRQIYGSFWFEKDMLKQALELYPDNLMFETDYPHPTSLSPGPASYARNPHEVIDAHLAGVEESILQRALHDTAARLYHLKSPALRTA